MRGQDHHEEVSQKGCLAAGTTTLHLPSPTVRQEVRCQVLFLVHRLFAKKSLSNGRLNSHRLA